MDYLFIAMVADVDLLNPIQSFNSRLRIGEETKENVISVIGVLLLLISESRKSRFTIHKSKTK